MTKQRYNEIRTAPNFLHQYFMEEKNARLPQQEFEIALDAWLSGVVQVHPAPGRMTIIQYLDGMQRS